METVAGPFSGTMNNHFSELNGPWNWDKLRPFNLWSKIGAETGHLYSVPCWVKFALWTETLHPNKWTYFLSHAYQYLHIVEFLGLQIVFYILSAIISVLFLKTGTQILNFWCRLRLSSSFYQSKLLNKTSFSFIPCNLLALMFQTRNLKLDLSSSHMQFLKTHKLIFL